MMTESPLGDLRNPFDDELALKYSAYAAEVGGELRRLLDSRTPGVDARFAHVAVRAAILHPDFPCAGAKAAVNTGSLRTAHYPQLGDESVTRGVARDLFAFVTEWPTLGSGFSSFVATFDRPRDLDEEGFEHLLWRQLSLLRAFDAPYHRWDPAVASDPASPRFAFSFGASALFVVGMHPGSGRWSRRLPFLALAFNPKVQFDRLRAAGKFERMRQTIRRADAALQGSINPMLEDFGASSDARQYSGRRVGPGWRCPFARS